MFSLFVRVSFDNPVFWWQTIRPNRISFTENERTVYRGEEENSLNFVSDTLPVGHCYWLV